MHRYELKERINQILIQAEDGTRYNGYDLKREKMRGTYMGPWPSLCCYKLSGSPEGDCDVSLVSMVYYSIALGCKEGWGIALQPGRLLNYQLLPRRPGNWALRGDTMNSYATTFHRYLRLLDQERKEGERLNPKKENWEEVVLRDVCGMENAVSPAALRFIRRTHTLGNMLPVPCRLNEAGDTVTASFNAPRYGRTKDYWDISLLCIWHYFTGLTDGTHTLEWMLPGAADHALCRAWLDSFGEGQPGWNRFVEQNLLQDFVNAAPGGGYAAPKELWPGHFTGGLMPDKAQCESFFANAGSWITARGKRMLMKAQETIWRAYDLAGSLEDLAEELLP